MNNPVVLIIPDIHGRQFYKNAISEAVDKNIEIVCLGDYLDPYFGDELHEDGVFAPLKELVELNQLTLCFLLSLQNFTIVNNVTFVCSVWINTG